MMKEKTDLNLSSRRQFLLHSLPMGTCLCLGTQNLWVAFQAKVQEENPPPQHKFMEDSKMSFRALFKFTFQNYYIPCLERLAGEIGRDKLIEMLKRLASESAARRQKESTKDLPNTDFATFVARSKSGMNRFVKHVLTWEDGERTETSVRTKFTECLWATTFREVNASDIGYAAICYPDYASASAFNPKIRLIRPTTLMEGHDCCDFQYVWEA
jgi:hypothetical protein